MNKQNSVIGCGYIPRDVEAICLKTNREAELGEVEYKIIAEPYEREWIIETFFPVSIGVSKTEKRMTVNVLDANTGFTYAVEYEPANLVRIASEPKTDKPGEKVEFIDRAQQIAEELAGVFSAGGGISDKCGVVFFTISDNGDGKTDSTAAFVGGRADRICESIAAACSKNSKVLELVKRGVTEAMLRRVFGRDGNNDNNE